tara:strand:- start:98 stop:994 length:897 start_codon:yes stop_codon:yes gene_type:complete
MSFEKLLFVAGTHGNEINPVVAIKKFQNLSLINNITCNSKFVFGNPKAIKKGVRYIDYDLNRAFNNKLEKTLYEINRAKYLVDNFGPNGNNPCRIAIDLHTTTANMGTSIVIYGRRETDFYLASILQSKFGLPIYLHEKDHSQTGFLVEAWPCGLVIEIGSVAQNFYDPLMIERFVELIKFIDNILPLIKNKEINSQNSMTVYVHQKSIDYPKDEDGNVNAYIHPARLKKDWARISEGSPLFMDFFGNEILYEFREEVYPVFIGEASYKEKNIAMSFTKKQVINYSEVWRNNFLENIV